MDTIENVIKLMRPDCYMASLDLTKAYFSVPIAQDFRCFLKFAIPIQSIAKWIVKRASHVHQDFKANLRAFETAGSYSPWLFRRFIPYVTNV